MIGATVRRRLALGRVPDAAASACIEDALRGVQGVAAADVCGGWLELAYGLPDASLARVESALAILGIALSRRWRDRFHRALIHYSEDCRLPALQAERRGGSKPCCNRPPK